MRVNAEVGIGISDYNAKAEIARGESKRFPVARIYNTGNETLIVMIAAELDSNDSGIKLTVDPTEVSLEPDETCLVYLTADCGDATPGTYQFRVEAKAIADSSENIVLPAAVADGEIVVTVEATASNDSPPKQDFSGGVILLVAGIGSSLIVAYAVRRMKRNGTH